MSGADLRRLFTLAALWGGSFIFIKVAVPVLGPVVMTTARVTVAGLALLLYARATRTPLEIRHRWRQYLLLGLLNSALPFALIATGQLRLSASTGAILNATSPLFGALIAAFWLGEPLTLRRVAGIAVAFSGVILLVGGSPLPRTSASLLALGAALSGAMCYGLAGAYTRAHLRGAPPMGMATGSQVAASLLLLPAACLTLPPRWPSAVVVGCVLALALLSTAWSFLIYFRLVVDVGATKALTVTFLTPIFGVLWGTLFLLEPLSPIKIGACAIILAGTALVTLAPGTPLQHTTGHPPAGRQTGENAKMQDSGRPVP